MPKTHVTLQEESFLINDRLTYSDIESSKPDAHGLLMNARFIQGVFDDKADQARFARFGYDVFDPSAHTDGLIAALPEWYAHGLRAFTVGFQGGGPFFTVKNDTIDNNPFGEDGTRLDSAYAERMDRLIKAADEIGMVVIVSLLYGGQTPRLQGGRAIRDAIITGSHFLKEGGYTNVIIETVNEYNIPWFNAQPLIQSSQGAAVLIDVARKESGGMLVGCSGGGGHADREVAEASDVILIHGNGCTRQHYYNLIQKVRSWKLNKPIVCNEDSQAVGQFEVAFKTRTSWGYYNNMTKQEPPADWSITPGEDTYFARRMAEGIGISLPPLPKEEHYHLHGLEPLMEYGGKRWLRLGSLYPETINYVDFYRNGELYYTAYDEPFLLHFQGTWVQGPYHVQPDDREWKAVIHLRDGDVIEKTVTIEK